MKEVPFLFSTEMIQAMLDGNKTMTRRVINPQPIIDKDSGSVFDGKYKKQYSIHNWKDQFLDDFSRCMPGDVIYAREDYKIIGWNCEFAEAIIEYQTGDNVTLSTDEDGQHSDKNEMWLVKHVEKLENDGIIKWVKTGDEENVSFKFTDKPHPFAPSIHLPKWGSRIWLEVTSVSLEQLHDITEDDAKAEGIKEPAFCNYVGETEGYQSYVGAFANLWNELNANWKENPWVWVIGFKVLSTTGKPKKDEIQS